MKLFVNNIEITTETIVATRSHYVEICKACIADATMGKFRVNDLEKYIKRQEQGIDNLNNGNCDHTLTFLQTAYWLQTGKMIPILS
jgi:hypothetical protein